MPKKIDVSIIIVHYKVKKELFACIASIITKTKKVSYEIIVVDNDENKTIEKDLKKAFPSVVYIPSPVNKGWGGGTNDGRYYAQGTYLYFLNPDTLLLTNAIYQQFLFIKNREDVGIVSAALVDEGKKEYPRMGAGKLTFIDGLVSFSFINTLFPKNPISQKHWFPNKYKNKIREMPVVPLAAAMIRNDLFKEIGKFDKRFFLYFEEYDLCRRIEPLKKKNYILSEAKVFHAWGVSSKHRSDTNMIYAQSRFRYFKKYYGMFPATLVDFVASINKSTLPLLLILGLALFLRLFRLSDLMPFIGDQGWFYLSAKDMFATGHIPLVGITSSHTWLHQGAVWTYILGFLFSISNFNPVFPAYVTSFIDTFTVYLLYRIGSAVFSRRVGLISSLMYAISPMVIMNARMPYHTSLIPFFVIILFNYLYLFVNKKANVFPLIIFFLAILYNLEIATSVIWFVVLSVVFWGIYYKSSFISSMKDKKNIFLSFAFGGFIMTPMILYDLNHGFSQTIKYPLWIGYKIISLITGGFHSAISITDFLQIIARYVQPFFFLPQEIVAMGIFLFTIVVVCYKGIYEYKHNRTLTGNVMLCLWMIICIGGVLANQTPSGAYMPLFFPLFALGVGSTLSWVYSYKKINYIVIFIFLAICIGNVLLLISNNYFMEQKNGSGLSFATRGKMVEQIITLTGTHPYVLQAEGAGSQFSSFTMNTQFLLWRKGYSPVRFAPTVIKISEYPDRYTLQKIAF